MKISTILKDIFLAFASTLLFGGGIGFLGVWLFNAEISTMLHVSVYIFGVMFVIWFLIDYQEMKNEQALQQAIREEEEKQQRMKEEKQRTISQLEQKYGHCTYVMAPYKKPFATDLVRIYSEARMMVIQGKEYRYDEILSCHISERDINDTAMETHTVTTPDNADVARRSCRGDDRRHQGCHPRRLHHPSAHRHHHRIYLSPHHAHKIHRANLHHTQSPPHLHLHERRLQPCPASDETN